MHRSRARLPILLFAATLLGGCHAISTGPSVSGEVSVQNENVRMDVVFGEAERRRIREYYARGRGLPPGLAKKDRLPPGLAKQVRRGGELPPGLQGRRLPAELERGLPRPPENYVRLQVGFNVVLMNRDTRVVVDIIEDVGEK